MNDKLGQVDLIMLGAYLAVFVVTPAFTAAIPHWWADELESWWA